MAFNATAAVFRRGYLVEMGEHPQTVGYSLTDSPVGLAAWMLDHDPDSYQKISHAFVDGEPVGGLTRDRILDNITLYWLTGTAKPAAGLYWEETRRIAAAAASGEKPPKLSLPVAFTVFPSEIVQAPRSWAKKSLPQPHLLPRGRQGRTLRRMGRAGHLQPGASGGLQDTALATRRVGVRAWMPALHRFGGHHPLDWERGTGCWHWGSSA
jgi:hypothetical protein